MPTFDGASREADMRELHHFETERENERLRALLIRHGIDPESTQQRTSGGQ